MASPTHVQETLLIPKAMEQDINRCFAVVQQERRKRLMAPLSRHDFLAYGLLKAGLQTFDATKEVYDREHRLVLLPHEVAR